MTLRSAVAAIPLAFLLVTSPAKAASLSGVVAPLVSKANEIMRSCGSVVVSGFRRNARVAGTRRVSLHASGHAVDLKGNPACIYAHLKGWPGGYSTDYRAVNHVHFSIGGRESGARFVHHRTGKQRHYAKRYRHHRRYV